MTIYEPFKPEPITILGVPCPECSARMMLACIEPEKPGYDRRTFECQKCSYSEEVVVNFE